MPRRTGGGESQVFLRLPHTQVHFISSIVFWLIKQCIFFLFYLSFHCRRVWGEWDGWELKWIDRLSDLLVSEIYYNSQASYIRMKNIIRKCSVPFISTTWEKWLYCSDASRRPHAEHVMIWKGEERYPRLRCLGSTSRPFQAWLKYLGL